MRDDDAVRMDVRPPQYTDPKNLLWPDGDETAPKPWTAHYDGSSYAKRGWTRTVTWYVLATWAARAVLYGLAGLGAWYLLARLWLGVPT